MEISRLFNRLTKICHSGSAITTRRSWNLHVFSVSKPRPIQVSGSPPEVPSGTETGNDALKATENLTVTDKAYSTAENVKQKTKDMGSKLSSSAQDMSEKAKQTMQNVWSSAKDKAAEGAESIKKNAETVKKSMNTEN